MVLHGPPLGGARPPIQKFGPPLGEAKGGPKPTLCSSSNKNRPPIRFQNYPKSAVPGHKLRGKFKKFACGGLF